MPAMDVPTEGNNVTTPALTEFSEAQFKLLFGTTDPKPADDAVGDGAMPSRHHARLASQDNAKRRRTDNEDTGPAFPAAEPQPVVPPASAGYDNLPCYGCLCETCEHCRAEGDRLDRLNATASMAKAAAAPIAKPPPAPAPVTPTGLLYAKSLDIPFPTDLHPLVLLVVGSGLLHSNGRLRVPRSQQELSLLALLVPLVPLIGNKTKSPPRQGLSLRGEALANPKRVTRC